jgi:A/G-specific adenine glycosylase
MRRARKQSLPALSPGTGEFRRALSGWFEKHGRDLPWRRTRDPYAVLVSEVMLQQTQVSAVLPYYNKWLSRFPTLTSLARAREPQVLRAWEGLGYYARARNLHRAAKLIVQKFGGELPHDPEKLQSLPGVGPYTANAVTVFAYNHSRPIVEANTARVLARLFDLRRPIDSAAGRKILWQMAAQITPAQAPRKFQSALMDLGALVCTARNPSCRICPVKKFCRARKPESLPIKGRRARTTPLHESHALITRGDHLLLQKCRTRWRGMWMLPPLWRGQPTDRPIHRSVFSFTNHRVTLKIFRERQRKIDRPQQRWFPVGALDSIPLPSPHRRAIVTLLNASGAKKSRQPRWLGS